MKTFAIKHHIVPVGVGAATRKRPQLKNTGVDGSTTGDGETATLNTNHLLLTFSISPSEMNKSLFKNIMELTIIPPPQLYQCEKNCNPEYLIRNNPKNMPSYPCHHH